VARVPRPGRIVSETRIEELGITEWHLSNGARVILKPTDFQNDEILLAGSSPGGNSLVPDQKYLSALFATTLLRDAGLGRFDQTSLEKALAGKAAGALPYIGDFEEGVRGTAAARDLDTMFQLVYLNLTSPRKDERFFLSFLAGLEDYLETRQADPEQVFQDAMAKALAQGDPRLEPITIARLGEINLEDAFQIYRERFADAGDFTFVLVGNFAPEAIRPKVLTWLGGLPSKGRQERWRDPGIPVPKGVVKVEVEKGLEPKSQVRIVFAGPAEFSRENLHVIESLARVLQIRLREVLREDMGGVYGVSVDGNIASRPHGRYSFKVGFGCAPENVEALTRAVFAEIESMQEKGVPETYLQRVREQERREREVASRENRFWIEALEFYYGEGLDPRGLLRFEELIAQVTSQRLQEAARTYLPEERHVLGVLRPEAAKVAAAPAQ
jgi:zinc protease